MVFELNGVTTANTRTVTIQDADGTMAYLADITSDIATHTDLDFSFPISGFTGGSQPIETEKPVLKGEIDWEEPHSILYYVDKNNPQAATPENPEYDSQYQNWEAAIKNWLE